MKHLLGLYGLYCTIIAFLYTKEPLLYNICYVEVDLNFFARDIAYCLGIILAGCTARIKNDYIREELGVVWVIYGIFHTVQAFLIDSEFSLITNTIIGILFLASILFIYEIGSRRNKC